MKILIIGGYGNFGKRLVTSLLKYHSHKIIIAGRSEKKCIAFQQFALRHLAKTVQYIVLNIFSDELTKILSKIKPDIVVNAVGPYQWQPGRKNYAVARACIATSCHYIDLADDRIFVSNFSDELNALAQRASVMLVCGASSVPGLSSAVIDHYRSEFSVIESINYGISPGNKTERGKATIASILSYTGMPFTTRFNGTVKQIFGWQGLSRHDFGHPLGKRWMSNCNIPDLALLPQQYPGLASVKFQAGLEVAPLHLGLWCLSWLSRIGLVNNWACYSHALTLMSNWFINWGSDKGGMFVELSGRDLNGQANSIYWQLVAVNGAGINVPTISAELIIEKIAKGAVKSGAMPCVGLFSLADFFNVAGRWDIRQSSITL